MFSSRESVSFEFRQELCQLKQKIQAGQCQQAQVRELGIMMPSQGNLKLRELRRELSKHSWQFLWKNKMTKATQTFPAEQAKLFPSSCHLFYLACKTSRVILKAAHRRVCLQQGKTCQVSHFKPAKHQNLQAKLKQLGRA